jgi:hypothetical protein
MSPGVRDGLSRDLFAEALAPVHDGRYLLDALRDAIGTVEWDEGEKIALRFARWLSGHGIQPQFREEVGEAD